MRGARRGVGDCCYHGWYWPKVYTVFAVAILAGNTAWIFARVAGVG